MRRLAALILLALLALPVPAQAQNDDDTCGRGLPCGPMPWPLPVLPTLQSPTPFPTVILQATPTPPGDTPTPTNTFTPTATIAPTQEFDIDELADRVGTLEALAEQTNEPIFNIDGTEEVGDFGPIATNSLTFFSYVKGLSAIETGPFSPLVGLMFSMFGFMLFITLLPFILPLIAAIYGFVRKVLSLIFDFLPG